MQPKQSFLFKLYKILPWLAVILMLIGFLFNRVVMNCGLLLAGIFVIWQWKAALETFRKPWLWTILALAICPILFDLVFVGFGFVEQRGMMKLALSLFPVFIFTWKPTDKEISIFHYIVILAMLLSSVYSMSFYFQLYSEIIQGYTSSKVMKVLSYGDHIRISWITLISCLLAFYSLFRTGKTWIKYLLIGYIVLQVLFLHILMSKTGLLLLYVSVAISIFWFLIKSRKKLALLFIPIFIALPFISLKVFPSFQQRIEYMKYDWGHYSKGKFTEGLSDAVRFYSIKAGVSLIKEKPLLGHGFCTLQEKTNQWYRDEIPHMHEKSYFLPSSEFLIYWASGGILGLCVFLAHIFMPFFVPKLRKSLWFVLFFVPAILSFTFETHIEGLLPLWVYGFFTAWFWWLAESEEAVKVLEL